MGVLIAAVIAAFVAESYFGSTRYTINGVSYAVPHKYEFLRQFSLPWLKSVKGLDADDPESIALLFPADEIAKAVPGYRPTFHGYDSDPPADMVVTVIGGKDALEFSQDRLAMIAQDQKQRTDDGVSKEVVDPETGMVRQILAT